MLKYQTVKSSNDLSKELYNKKIKLQAIQGTALSELSDSINKLMTYNNIIDEESVSSLITMNSNGTYAINPDNKKEYLTSTHDVVITTYQDKLANLVAGYIKFAKSTVKETAKDLYEKVNTSLDEYKFREPEDFFNVTYYNIDDIFNSSLITVEILPYRDFNNLSIDYIGVGKLNSENLDVRTYLLTSNEEIDELIKIWIEKVTPEVILSYINSEIQVYSLDLPDLINYNLANYLFYRNLTEKTDLNLGYGITQLRVKGSNNRNAFGFNLYMAIDQYNKAIRNGLIITANSDHGVSLLHNHDITYNVTIYEESFKKMVEKDIPIECIFGYITNEKDYDITVDKLEKNKDYYLNIWKNIRSLYSIKLNSSKIDIFKNILTLAFNDQMNNMSDEEKELIKDIYNYNEIINTKFNDFLKNINPDDIEKVDHICLHLVAGVRYYYSNALYILEKMENILALDENITPDEASLYAIADYLVDFFMTQLKVIKL